MKKKTSTALALPKMAPPVKKAEIVEALYLLAFEQFKKENDERKIRREELIKQWDEALAPLLLNPRSVQFGKPHTREDHDISVTVKMTSRLKTIGQKYNETLALHWDEKYERQRIAEGIKGHGNRAQNLLDDPVSRQALESMLAKIEG